MMIIRFKKMIAVCLAVVLMFSLSTAVFASGIENGTYVKINEALQGIEPIKVEMGLANVDFSDFTVGEPIYVYNYIQDTLVKSREYYPLLIDSVLTAFAIETEEGVNAQYQITTAFVDKILESDVDNTTPFAIIYDYRAVFLYYNGTANLLEISNEESPERGDILNCNNDTFFKIHLQDMSNSHALNYACPTISARTQVYYSCNISQVLQGDYEWLCWAACIACIVNYKTGSSLTAADVAARWYDGEDNIDQGASPGTVCYILERIYGFPYTTTARAPSDGDILLNIVNDYPVIGCFGYGGVEHAVVIYATHVTAGRVYIMDPINGFMELSYSEEYHRSYYISPKTNKTMYLLLGCCRYWQ